MRNFILLLFLISVSFTAFGNSQIPSDTITMGKGNNAVAKKLIFNVGDGATNPLIQIDPTNKDFTLNKELKVLEDITLGTGAAADQKLIFDIGSGASNPFLKWSNTHSSITFSNDGTLEKKIGSGSGGGSGGILSLDNAGFEDGITSEWTCTSSRCFVESADPLVGEKSLRFSPTVQNDSFQSVLKAIPEGLKGVACEARVYYTGGDENLTAQVVNGDAEVVAEQVLKAHSIAGYESIFFLCPTKAAIIADSDKGDLQLKVYNEEATVSPVSRFDEMYLGSLIGLVETQLPDILTARIDQSTMSIESENTPWLSSLTAGTGILYLTPIAGVFSVLPSCTCTTETSAGTSCMYDSAASTVNSLTIRVVNVSGAAADHSISINCSKQGADAKQSVQVYKSIPKVAENINLYGARVGNSGSAALISQNVQWVDSVNRSSIGTVNVNWASLGLTHIPSIELTNDGGEIIYFFGLSTTEVNVRTASSAGTLVDRGFSIRILRHEDDYKMPTVQPILVNQVETSVVSGVRVESCRIVGENVTTRTINGTKSCASWITSASYVGTGTTQIFFDSFGEAPDCNCTVNYSNAATGSSCSIYDLTHQGLKTHTYDTNGSGVNRTFSINCAAGR